MSDRYDQLQPPHIISALRSMPRRWTEALYLPPPKNVEDVFRETGKAGVSAAEDSGAALAMLSTLDDAIRTTTYTTPEPLGSDVTTAMQNDGTGPWPASASDAISEVTELTERMADRLSAIGTHDWTRQSGSTTISQLAQGAVRVAAERLARAERTIREYS